MIHAPGSHLGCLTAKRTLGLAALLSRTQYFLAPGTYQVQSQYSGDTHYQGAYSFAVFVVVTALPPTFTVSAPSLTIGAPGANSGNTSVITVNSQNGFTGTVNFTCNIKFQGAGMANDPPTCILSNSGVVSLTSSTTSGTLTASFATTAASGTGRVAGVQRPLNPTRISTWPFLGESAIFASLLLLPRGIRRKSLIGKTTSVALIFWVAALGIGCGGGQSSSGPTPPTNQGTTTGAYTVTISGTSGNVAVSTTFTLTLQ